MVLSDITSEIKRDIHTQPGFDFDVLIRAVPWEYCHKVWYEKLDWCGYPTVPTVKKSLTTCLAVSTQYRRVTDGQTDVRTA